MPQKKQMKAKARPAKRRARRSRKAPRQPSASLINGGWAYPKGSSRANSGFPTLQPKIMRNMVTACCALVDPFSEMCRGCKLPDGQNGKSMPFQIRGHVGLVVDSGGYACMQFAPVFPYGILNTASRSSATYTLNADTNTYYVPSVFSNFSNFRVVCGAIKLVVNSSVPNTSGSIILSTLENAIATGGTWTSGSLDALEVFSSALATGKEFIWTTRPVGPRTFQGCLFNSTTNTGGNNAFTSLVVDLYGGTYTSASAATSIDVEYVFNLECQFITTSGSSSAGFGHLTPPDPPPNPRAINHAAEVHRRIPTTHEGNTDSFSKKVEAVAQKVAIGAFEKGGEYLLEGLSAMFI